MYVGVLEPVTKLSGKFENFLVSYCPCTCADNFAQREPGIISGVLYLEFLMNKATAKHFFLLVPLLVPVNIIPQILHINSSNMNFIHRDIILYESFCYDLLEFRGNLKWNGDQAF